MNIIGAHHIALLTANFDRLFRFYVDTLGLPVVGSFAGYRIVFIAVGSVTIELEEDLEADEGRAGRGWQHLALEVADVDAAYADLTARGVPFDQPPANFPDYAPRARNAFFRDPDGNALELFQWVGAGR